MKLYKWEDIPSFMRNDEVKYYYDILDKKRGSLIIKRTFDIILSIILIILLSPMLLIISIVVKLDSKGPIFYRQERITQYGKKFLIYKFRTMSDGADKKGPLITVENDDRITKSGNFLRKSRLDEIPQLFNILVGDMTFVGTRPEVEKYVKNYSDKMKATLLLPAGVTSSTSIIFKDESEILKDSLNIDNDYLNKILPQKMKYNLKSIESFSFTREIKVILNTVISVVNIRREYER